MKRLLIAMVITLGFASTVYAAAPVFMNLPPDNAWYATGQGYVNGPDVQMFDADFDQLIYATNSPYVMLFRVNNNTGRLYVTQAGAELGPGIHDITISVTDGVNVTTQAITVYYSP